MQLNEMIGQAVFGLVPIIHKTTFQQLMLLGVEAGGIWVECQALTDTILKVAGVSSSPATPVFFLPFSQVSFLLVQGKGMSLSEKALGL